VDGTPADGLKLKNYPGACLQTGFAYLVARAADGSTMVAGKWWDNYDTQSLAVNRTSCAKVHLHLGSRLVLTSNGRTIQATVSA